MTPSILAPTVAVVALFCVSSPAKGALQEAVPPNILLLMADDLGYADLGCYGAPLIATPRIDAMAASGVRLTSFYAQPTCSPTRAAILTGSHPERVGIPRALSQWGEFGLNGAEVTIAEVLASVGYATGFYGKWHVGDSPSQLPAAQGFQDVLANPWGYAASPSAYIDSALPDWEWNPDARFDTQRLTTRAASFVQQSVSAEQPFFCLLSYNVPHWPAVASPAFEGISADGREYGDAVEEMDASVGSLIDLVDALGVSDNTLIVFLSDNGPALSQGAYQAGATGNLRGSKGSTFEGGVRVPFVARWTGVLPADTVIDEPLADLDFMPTLAALAGAPTPPVTLDGEDMLPVLRQQANSVGRPFYYATYGVVRGVRLDRWKLHQGELFDLVADIAETTDVAAANPSIVLVLQGLIDGFAASLAGDSRPAGPRTYIRSDWRVDTGLGAPTVLGDGSAWSEVAYPGREWTVVDQDPTADLEQVARVGPAPGNVSSASLRQSTPGNIVRLERSVLGPATEIPFTVGVWSRSLSTPSEAIVLLDVGDGQEGFSITIGDGGLLGDDVAAGRFDDVRVRIGGSQSPVSAALTADMPGAWETQAMHIAVTHDEQGQLILYVQGIEVDRTSLGTPAGWGATETAALWGRSGVLGGDGGAGDRPFAASGGLGDLSGFDLRDRALTRGEIERLYCRSFQYRYCPGRTNSVGLSGNLSLSGSFYLVDEALTISMTDLPVGTFGYLIASATQGRAPISSGYVCVNNPIYRLAGQVLQSDPTGAASFVLDRSLAPVPLGLSGSTHLNFQFWYRDGAASNFTNAISVVFAP
ncbi:MAG: arylsulfatase A-like enzyme [Planctomycetota bacterium]|jgi:arylsulfatase A-like enzyme